MALPDAGGWERIVHAHCWLRAAPDTHPMTYLRPLLGPHVRSIRELYQLRSHSEVLVAGVVTARQRPETAHGILFQLLEDETEMLNVIVTPEQQERRRDLYRTANLVVLQGLLERRTARPNLIAGRVWRIADLLPDKGGAARIRGLIEQNGILRSRDFR